MTQSDTEVAELLGLTLIEAAPTIASHPPIIITRGAGGQDKARAAGGRYLYQLEPRGGRANAFHGFATAAERDIAAAAHLAAGHEIVERVDGSKPARPYIDVDGAADAATSDLDAVIAAFAAVAARWGAPTGKTAPIINACDRPEKRSRHLIADGWAVPNGLAVARFALEVKAELGTSVSAAWVDRSGGDKSYGLRIAGCPKKGDATALLTGPLTWLQTDGDQLITPPAPALAATAKPRSKARTATNNNTVAVPPAPTLKSFLLSIVVAFASIYALEPTPAAGTVVASYNRIAPGDCTACGRAHDRAGAYVNQSPDGSLFLRCRQTPTTGPALRKMLARRKSRQPPTMPAADAHDDLGNYNKVGGPGIYNAEAIGDGPWDLYAASCWGTGKSQHNAAIVAALRKRKRTAVVIIISCRKSLSAQLAHDIGAISYDRIRGTLDVNKTPITVWQLDSLARIGPDVEPDLVIVDELSQLAAHAWQGGNVNSKAAAGMSSLRALVQRAGRIVVSDNDLTSAHVEAFKKIRPGKEARVVRNAFQPWAKTRVRLQTGPKAPMATTAELWKTLDEAHARRAAGQSWEAAAAPCHSLKVARQLTEEATRRYGAAAVRLYTGETGDDTKRHDFADATSAWDPADGSGPLLVVYTSTISVGVSCTSERFTRCFAFFQGQNAAAAQSAQMLFRCRKLRSVHIAFDSRPQHNLPQEPADLFRWAVNARNIASLPDAFRHDRNPYILTPTASDSDALAAALTGNFEGSLWVANAMEANRSARWFVPRLQRIIERAGMVVTVEVAGAIEAGTSEADKAAIKAAAEVAAAAQAEIQAAADGKRATQMAGEMPRRHAEANEDVNGEDEYRDKTTEDKAGDRACAIASAFGQNPLALAAHFAHQAADAAADTDSTGTDSDSDDSTNDDKAPPRATLAGWLAAYEPLKEQYHHASAIAAGIVGAQPRGLAVVSNYETYALTREVFRVLGAEPCAETLEVEPATLQAAAVLDLAKRINAHASRIYGNCDGARRTDTIEIGKTQGRRLQAVVTTLNVVLGHIGATLGPVYATARRKKQGAPARWALTWAWANTPEPRPSHPRPIALDFNAPEQDAAADPPAE